MSDTTNVPAKPPRRAFKTLKRDEAVRRLSRRIATECPWIAPIDGPLVRGWAQLERLAQEAYARLQADGIMRVDGTAHPLLSEIVKLRRAQTQLGAQLGLGPRARSDVAAVSRTMKPLLDLEALRNAENVE